MQKRQLTLVIVSLLVVVLSVSLAWFTTQIIGKGKDVSVTSANLQIVFTDTDGEIAGADIEPGWSATKTFTIKNDTKTEYKYNIVIKDLLNTFVTNGYLQYKITSTNDGYNMTEFKDIPKSSIATDTVLAYSVSVPVGITQTYTIEFKYANNESVDQSDDMGKKLSGTLFITEGTKKPPKEIQYPNETLGKKLLEDKTERTISTRPDNNLGNASYGFGGMYSLDNTKTLYTSTESDTQVYYFAGNSTDNWVKFGGFYWRIIRTNADGSIRLLYHGTSHDSTNAYIGFSKFSSTINYISKYVGYMYDSNGTNSTIKAYIDSWYKDNLLNYTKYLSTTAVYCNDRTSTVSDGYTDFGASTRLDTNKTPTYDCTNTSDAFSVSNTSAKLDYPIGLMTADEVSFAGGGTFMDESAPAYYYQNSAGNSSTSDTWWWTMSPNSWREGVPGTMLVVYGSREPGILEPKAYGVLDNIGSGVRPVISLKSCVKYSSGNGSASDPYTIKETETGC